MADIAAGTVIFVM